jgi:TRAP-type mannitol/chloroaromatic compound transport system permease small subunit
MALRADVRRLIMRERLLACSRGIDRWSRWWGSVAGLFTLFLSVLVVLLVIARYCFAWNMNGLDELCWHCFAAIFLLAMAGCLAENGHVRVDVLSQRLPRRLRLMIEVVMTLTILVPFCGIMVWQGVRDAYGEWSLPSTRHADHWSKEWSGSTESTLYKVLAPVEGFARATVIRGGMSPSGGGLEARWIVKSLIPFGFLLLGLQGLAHALRQALRFAGVTDPEETSAETSGAVAAVHHEGI